jgi:hypothetical protein
MNLLYKLSLAGVVLSSLGLLIAGMSIEYMEPPSLAVLYLRHASNIPNLSLIMFVSTKTTLCVALHRLFSWTTFYGFQWFLPAIVR